MDIHPNISPVQETASEGEYAMSAVPQPIDVDQEVLREEIRKEYRAVASNPQKGFHFHTGRRLAEIVEYREEWLRGVPEPVLASFAGTGNPFSIAPLKNGERVVDLGCGAGIDSFIAAHMVGPQGAVCGVDMTEEMLEKAKQAHAECGLSQLRFEKGFLEDLPIEDGWADVVISNGAINLSPNKYQVFREIHRVLRPGGRIQFADIIVRKPISDSAKKKIDLWTG
jgi:arsenite methyltransferase